MFLYSAVKLHETDRLLSLQQLMLKDSAAFFVMGKAGRQSSNLFSHPAADRGRDLS